MTATLLALGTAVPPGVYPQRVLAALAAEHLGLAAEPRAELLRVAERSAIEQRHLALDPARVADFAGARARNELYCSVAPALAVAAARDLFARLPDIAPASVTHVVAVSCTGVMAPGIEIALIEALGLHPATSRFGLNLMGCFGAFRGLHLAQALAAQSPTHRVLLVCVELCSLHFQLTRQPDILVGNVLFADGAAAALVQADAPGGLYTLERFASALVPGTGDEMSWRVGDAGFEMRLSPRVPVRIKRHVGAFAERLLARERWGEACWALHPGGRDILAVIEDACGLRRDQTEHSWAVLREFGNMSSATVLFVLEQLRGRTPGAPVVALGFGPGLSVEGILLTCQ